MDENRIEGTARKYGGRVQEGVGSVTGDTKTRVEGAMNEAAGAAQQLYGQTSDVLVRRQRRSTHGCATRSKPSLIRLPSLHWVLAGCWAECIGRCR
jgi:uncharacterized protein YjbJ (UPF0337 family)